MDKIKSFEISRNDEYGSFLKATRHFKPGEIIFKDKPIVVGPKNGTDLCCVSCYSILNKRIHPCKYCKLAPLCGPECENHNGGHTELECEMYGKLQGKLTIMKLVENFHIVTLLRCLQLRSDQHWGSLMSMENHVEKRRGRKIWKHHENIAKIISELFEDESINEELIQQLCGVIDVNSFELRTQSKRNGEKIDTICGIYPTAALMAHSCKGNTHLSVDGDFTMTIRASVAIEKDSEIYFNYANPLHGTILRKRHLREGKYFECLCVRCSDPTELGTYMSSIKCQKCTIGKVVVENPHVEDPLVENIAWKCMKCGEEVSGKHVLQILENMAVKLKAIDASSEKDIEAFLTESSKYLPDNHHFRVDAKQALAGLLRDSINISINPSKKLMQKVVNLCKDFLPLIDAIEPGLSRMRAITLYELHFPIVQIANREKDSKFITSEEHLKRLLEAEAYLKEAVRLLLVEPSTTPEGALCKRAITELKSLKNTIQTIGIINDRK